MGRVVISLSQTLIDMTDEAAEKDFTTRSDIIRTALLWYLRPQGRDLAQTNPDEIVKVLQRRKTMAYVNSIRNQLDYQE